MDTRTNKMVDCSVMYVEMKRDPYERLLNCKKFLIPWWVFRAFYPEDTDKIMKTRSQSPAYIIIREVEKESMIPDKESMIPDKESMIPDKESMIPDGEV